MKKEEVEKYKNYPEGSGGKEIYDLVNLSFYEYLNKYYANPKLERWDYINRIFINPFFIGTSWDEYLNHLKQIKPDFLPEEDKLISFYEAIKSDKRFDLELKRFFALLYSISFFRKLSFEEWLESKNWAHPWYKDEDESQSRSILEILKHTYGMNYLKKTLAELPIFK